MIRKTRVAQKCITWSGFASFFLSWLATISLSRTMRLQRLLLAHACLCVSAKVGGIWCTSAPHPNSPSLIETQSELADRRRTAARWGTSIYKHWLHLGWRSRPLTCGYVTKQQPILCCSQVPHGQWQLQLFFFFSGAGSSNPQPCFLFWGPGQMFWEQLAMTSQPWIKQWQRGQMESLWQKQDRGLQSLDTMVNSPENAAN